MHYNRYNNNPKAKLNWHKVAQIRKLWLNGVSQTALAKKYNIAITTIHRIITNKLWVKETSK